MMFLDAKMSKIEISCWYVGELRCWDKRMRFDHDMLEQNTLTFSISLSTYKYVRHTFNIFIIQHTFWKDNEDWELFPLITFTSRSRLESVGAIDQAEGSRLHKRDLGAGGHHHEHHDEHHDEKNDEHHDEHHTKHHGEHHTKHHGEHHEEHHEHNVAHPKKHHNSEEDTQHKRDLGAGHHEEHHEEHHLVNPEDNEVDTGESWKKFLLPPYMPLPVNHFKYSHHVTFSPSLFFSYPLFLTTTIGYILSFRFQFIFLLFIIIICSYCTEPLILFIGVHTKSRSYASSKISTN